MNINRTLFVMKKAAVKAGAMLSTIQPITKRLAARKDFLTDADLKSEKLILKILKKEFPNIPVLSEEQGGEEKKEGFLWVIDPVDGTVNYFCQDDHWGVSIALVRDGKSVAGVVFLPCAKKMYYAPCSSSRFRVSDDSDLSQSQVWNDWCKEEHGGQDHQGVLDIMDKLDRRTLYPQLRLCCTASMMRVAEGKITGYVHSKPQPFDIAAACLIVEQAGGIVTDLEGKPWTPFSRSIVATNGKIHDELLSVLR